MAPSVSSDDRGYGFGLLATLGPGMTDVLLFTAAMR